MLGLSSSGLRVLHGVKTSALAALLSIHLFYGATWRTLSFLAFQTLKNMNHDLVIVMRAAGSYFSCRSFFESL